MRNSLCSSVARVFRLRVASADRRSLAEVVRPALSCATTNLLVSACATSCATVFFFACATATAATLHDPRLRFRTLSTAHFIIYYHQGEDPLAERLAAIAEDTWQTLRQPLGATPPARTHVVLVDETELANGSASPFPYNTIVLTAAWPAGSEFLGNTDDWLRLVFTHEFTHIVHLDRSEGWARVLRGIFGRTPVAFPNVFLPAWQIEGLATYEESAVTGEGRLHAGDFRAIVDQAARARRLEPLDRVNGGLTDWPGGLAAYAYGAGFHAYLADRFGSGSFATLADAMARRVPFTSSRVFERLYGRSLGALWRDYQASLATAAEEPTDAGVQRLTRQGFVVLGPRFARSACDICPAEVVYSVRSPDGFPSLNRLVLDGSAPTRLVRRYLGSTTAVGRSTIVFDQQDLRRNKGLYSDLYALDRGSGRVRRVTFEARLLDPDLTPDEQTIVAVRNAPGRRDLVLVRLKPDATTARVVAQDFSPAGVTTLLSEPETQFNAPRWSPDGRTVAVERHRRGGPSEIVVVDVATELARVVASSANARLVTPAWRPDGRAIVAAADLNGGPFNLYEFRVDASTAPRQLTHLSGGATWPDVSADGRAIVFVGYTADGFDLFQMPYPSAVAQDFSPALVVAQDFSPAVDVARDFSPALVVARDFSPAPAQEVAQDISPVLATTNYTPLPTLKPTSWSPIIEGDREQLRVGAATSGVDVLGYHIYFMSATWLVSSPAGAATATAVRPDWQLYYAYDRWRPRFWVSASTDTSFFAGPADDSGVPSRATLRERQLEAGVLFPVRHVRTSVTALASLVRAVDDFTRPDGSVSRTRTAARAAWSVASAHTYGYSISREEGAIVGVTAELIRRALGSSGDATAVTADARIYAPALASHHVLAVRLAGGRSSGDGTIGRTFHLGGATPNLDPLTFGRDAISLLRGFPADTFAGSHVAVMNADYRWPIARPQRGIGTWPLFVHTLHGAVFADAGHAWTRAFDAHDLKSSAGAELSFDLVAAYSVPFTATVGAAWGRDGSRTVANGTTVYVRIGRAF